jgi:proteasome lid subunit RPN8/RPN11
VQIAADLLEQIVEHARRDAPDECCGVVVTRDGRAEEVVALENLASSPFRFEVDGLALLEVLDRAEASGARLGVIYHSHTRSAPEPSQTDVNFAANWPGVEWLIVGLAGGGEPDVRSWLIEDGDFAEVAVEVSDA